MAGQADQFRFTGSAQDGMGRPREVKVGTTGNGRVRIVAPEGFTLDPDEADTLMYFLEACIETARDEAQFQR